METLIKDEARIHCADAMDNATRVSSALSEMLNEYENAMETSTIIEKIRELHLITKAQGKDIARFMREIALDYERQQRKDKK